MAKDQKNQQMGMVLAWLAQESSIYAGETKGFPFLNEVIIHPSEHRYFPIPGEGA